MKGRYCKKVTFFILNIPPYRKNCMSSCKQVKIYNPKTSKLVQKYTRSNLLGNLNKNVNPCATCFMFLSWRLLFWLQFSNAFSKMSDFITPYRAFNLKPFIFITNLGTSIFQYFIFLLNVSIQNYEFMDFLPELMILVHL